MSIDICITRCNFLIFFPIEIVLDAGNGRQQRATKSAASLLVGTPAG